MPQKEIEIRLPSLRPMITRRLSLVCFTPQHFLPRSPPDPIPLPVPLHSQCISLPIHLVPNAPRSQCTSFPIHLGWTAAA